MTTAIVDFASLQTALTSWIGDNIAAPNYNDFIGLFEKWFDRRSVLLGGIRQMETSTTLPLASSALAIPADYLAWRSVEWAGLTPPRKLRYVHPGDLRTSWITTIQGGTTEFFTIEDGTLTVRPLDTANNNVTLRYWQRLTPLSNSATTNWLITAYPDIYLFGSLVESCAFKEHDDYLTIWRDRRDATMSEIVSTSNLSKGESGVREDEWF